MVAMVTHVRAYSNCSIHSGVIQSLFTSNVMFLGCILKPQQVFYKTLHDLSVAIVLVAMVTVELVLLKSILQCIKSLNKHYVY